MAKKSNTMLYVGLGAVALGLFYFMRSKAQTKAEMEEPEESTGKKRGFVEVGPTETITEAEFNTPVSKAKATVEEAKETLEMATDTVSTAVKSFKRTPAQIEARKKRIAERKAKRKAQVEAKKKKVKKVRRRKKSIGEYNFI